MVASKINMHGKIYDLLDEVDRPVKEAKAKLAEIHATGKRAFLNPRKRKNFETTYYIYTADPTPRKVSEPKKVEINEEVVEKTKKNEKKNGKKVPAKKNRKKVPVKKK